MNTKHTGFVGRGLLATALVAALLGAVAASPAPAQTTAAGFDGDPSTTERLLQSHPVHAAVEISQLRFGPVAGAGRRAAHVVLSRDDNFADSVAGSALTTDGPLLLTPSSRLPEATAAEIERILPPAGTVFLLGGEAAISGAVADDLAGRGFRVRRLAGPTRIETALAVADAVRSTRPGDGVLLARAWGPSGNDTAAWADSVAGGAVAAERGTPILITRSDVLDGAVKAWLDRDQPASTVLLGGPAALSMAVEQASPNASRVSGADRTATAAAIATQLWGVSASGPRRFLVGNGAADDGWAFGFASAGLAADSDAPVLLVTSKLTEPTTALARTCGEPEVDLLVVGDGTVVPPAMRQQLDVADGHACGPRGAIVYPDDLSGFPACSSLLDWFRETALEYVGPWGLGGYGFPGQPMPLADGAPPPAADSPGDGRDTGGANEGAGGGDSSSTNTQEEGVDEPDIVETDGRHLYSVSGNTLRVVRLDAAAPQVVGSLELDPNAQHELLLSGSRLLVVSRSFGFFVGDPGGPATSDSMAAPGQSSTILTWLDVTDPTRPTVLSSLEVDGDYRSARSIEGVARLVVQTEPGPFEFSYPRSESDDELHRAAEHNRDVIRRSTLDHWLPAYETKAADGSTSGQGQLVPCEAVKTPPIFSGLGTLSVVTVEAAGQPRPTSSAAVVAAGETVYASASRLFVATSRWDWEPDSLGTGPSTEVHGFDISTPTATTYRGSGSVPGYTLNQFSMSEHAGHLRIATTTQPPWADPRAGETDNGVHVLAEGDGGYPEVGKVRGLGRGERIQSVRFYGDLGAVVTFRQIDPLYLLDLSQPATPRVTGELKVPGFSTYLHRVSPDRLVGVGREADDEGRVTGSQVSMFDIGDRTAPKLVERRAYPEGYSAAEGDHHAFLHWPATGLVVVPMVQYTERGVSFDGAIGYDVSGGRLPEKGRTSHQDDAGADTDTQIQRSVVAGGLLWTVSSAGVEAAELSTLAERAFVAF
jgi:putative cell wall-binding protein